MIRFQPTKDRVLVEPIVPTEDRVGGIAIPQACRDKPSEGVVIKTGPQVTELAIADRVIFNRFEGEDISIGGKLFKLFKQPEILAIID